MIDALRVDPLRLHEAHVFVNPHIEEIRQQPDVLPERISAIRFGGGSAKGGTIEVTVIRLPMFGAQNQSLPPLALTTVVVHVTDAGSNDGSLEYLSALADPRNARRDGYAIREAAVVARVPVSRDLCPGLAVRDHQACPVRSDCVVIP
jgi:hypothetical protein